MLKELIEIANTLDEAGLTKEASELDDVINKMAQTWPPSPEMQQKFPAHEMMAVNGRLSMLKKELHAAVDAEIRRLEGIIYSPPEDYVGTLEGWLDSNLPITVTSK